MFVHCSILFPLVILSYQNIIAVYKLKLSCILSRLDSNYYDPIPTDAEKSLFVKIGMNNKADCSHITNDTTLTLYVGKNVTDMCQVTHDSNQC